MSTTPEEQHENYDLDAPQQQNSAPFADRILGREAFYIGAKPGTKSADLQLDREARCFVLRRPQRANLYGGVEFKIQTGISADFTIFGRVFYSAARLNEGWTYLSKQGKSAGKNILGIQYGPADKCALAKLVQNRPELIAPLKFKKAIQYWPAKGDQPAQAKKDYKKLFACELYEVLFEFTEVADPANPGKTKRVAVTDPTTHMPKYTIDPQPYIWKMNDPWWEQLRAKVLAPDFAKALESVAAADIDGDQAAKPRKELPKKGGVTVPVSSIILKLWAKTDEVKSTPTDVVAKYEVDFSAGMTVDSLAIVPTNPFPSLPNGDIDWHQIFVPMTQEQADKIVADADREMGEMEDHGDSAGGGKPQGGPPPSDDDDIPF